MLLKWVKVSEERFNEMLDTVTEAKNKWLKTNVDGREITVDNVGNGLLDERGFKYRYNSIVDDVEAVVNKVPITRSQAKIVEILSLLKEISPDDKKSYKQPNTTDMPELDSEESTAERRNPEGGGLKILTPDQMLSRLPINNSQKLINEIRQLMYSLYRS